MANVSVIEEYTPVGQVLLSLPFQQHTMHFVPPLTCIGGQSRTSPTPGLPATIVTKDKDGVHDEGLESDDIIAILILGLALLISVTTVVAVFKSRERKVLIRRIRRRHRYLPSHASETNVSVTY